MQSIIRFFAVLGAAIGAAAMASSAAAQTRDSVTADELETILTDAGLGPTLIADAATGAPVASATVGEVKFWVRALDCSGSPKACENLVFFANFNLPEPLSPKTYVTINRFNESQVFGRAYIIEGKKQVGVDYVIELGGGVSMDHVTKNVSRWADVIANFIEKFREGQASS